jgi:WD40 repeat protein
VRHAGWLQFDAGEEARPHCLPPRPPPHRPLISPPPPPPADPVTGRALPPPRRLRPRLPHEASRTPGSIIGTLPTARQGATSVAVSPDGSLVAVACIADQGFPVRVFEVWRGREVACLEGHGNIVYQVTWHPRDGQWLLTASGDGSAIVWHLPRASAASVRLRAPARAFSRLSHAPPAYVYTARFHPTDANVVVTGSYDKGLRVWDARMREAAVMGASAGALEASFLGFVGCEDSAGAAASKRAPSAASGAAGALASTFRPGGTGAGGGRVDAHGGYVNCIEFDDGADAAGVARRMLTADSLGVVCVWDISAAKPNAPATYTLLRELRPSAFKGVPIVSMQVRPGHAQLLLFGQSDLLRLFDLNTFAALRAYPNARCTSSRLDAAFSPDGKFIAAGSEDGQLCLWEADTGASIPARAVTGDGQRIVLGYPALLLALAWSPTHHMLAIGAFGLEYPVMLCT